MGDRNTLTRQLRASRAEIEEDFLADERDSREAGDRRAVRYVSTADAL